MKKFYSCKNELIFNNIFYNEKNKKLLKKLIENSLGTDIEILAIVQPMKINDFEFDKNELLTLLAKIEDKLTYILLYAGSYYDGCHNVLFAHALNKLNEENKREMINHSIGYDLGKNNVIEINYIWNLPEKYKGIVKGVYKFYSTQTQTILYDNFSIIEFNMDEIAKQETDESKKYKSLNILNFNQEQLDNIENPTEFDLEYNKIIKDLNNNKKFIEYMNKDH